MQNLTSLTILGFILAFSLSKLVVPIDHILHQSVKKRHNLATSTHHTLRNHHNVHKLKKATQHLAAIPSESYGVNDMGYYMTLNITVGGIFYRLNLDTGSSDFWVKGQDTPKNPPIKYKCSQCVAKNPHYTLDYSDGYVSAYLLDSERVTLGNHSFNASVLIAYQVDRNFEVPQGIIGLGYPSQADNPKGSFIQDLINQKIIDNYSFGININFQEHGRSFISFGEPDPSKYQGQLTFYKLDEDSSDYQLQSSGVRINNNRILKVESAILDSGNSCITLPSFYQQQTVSQFTTEDKTNVCTFDNQPFATEFSLLRCIIRDFDKMPVLKIILGSKTFDIDKNGYMQRCVIDGQLSLCDTFIQISDGESQMMLGGGFLTSVYSFFDLANRRIGLAENREALDYRKMYVSYEHFDEQDKAFFADLKNKIV